MSGLTIGSLCSGYGGLDMAVEAAFGATTAWVSDIDKGACKILAHRYPDIPNIGDMTTVNWSYIEPVDIIAGGTPCQDLSHAGKRAGMTEGTRSNLWVAMREAIAELRPTYVIWENVRGAYSAAADSALEQCAGCMGDGQRGPVLRALGRVLGDLSDLGYDTQWRGLRAADVGAPHGRFRVFVVARAADSGDGAGYGQRARTQLGQGSEDAADAQHLGHERAGQAWGRRFGPADSDRGPVALLPTPAVNDMGAGKTVDAWDAWDAWTDRMRAEHANGNGHGASLSIEALRLLPTPTVQDGENTAGPSTFRRNTLPLNAEVTLLPTVTTTQRGTDANLDTREGAQANLHNEVAKLLPTTSVADAEGGRKHRSGGRSGELLLNGIAAANRWGQYAYAIARWEHTLGRVAPDATEEHRPPRTAADVRKPVGMRGRLHRHRRLSPRFTEWMMGVPDGWITDTPGLTRNEALKACGNGVVPQQAYAAIVDSLAAFAEVAA